MNVQEVKETTEKVLTKAGYNFKCNPYVDEVKEYTRNRFLIRIMWGFDNEGIEIFVPNNMKNTEELFIEIVNKIDKDLNGIFHYSEALYWSILEV